MFHSSHYKAKRSPAAAAGGASVTSSPAALVVQSSDEEELPIAVAIRIDDGAKEASA